MKLIVGLGNPGANYENTRHNIGFKLIDFYANHLNLSFDKNKFNGIFYKGENFILAKPLTFMNLSGDFVLAIVNFYKIKLEDILIIYDDISFEVGIASMKLKGTSGGQNGMKDIILKLDSNLIPRLKIGIGRDENKNLSDYVLSHFSKLEEVKLNQIMPCLIKTIDFFINNDFVVATSYLNSALKKEGKNEK